MEYVGKELGLFQHVENWKRYWSSKIRPYLRGDVLEVGAGIGANTLLLRQAHLGHWVCLEPDPSLVQTLRERLTGCEVIEGTTASLEKSRSFQSILYVDVLEHIADDRGELRRAGELLAPGGMILVLSPAHSFLYSEFDREIGHVRRYDRKSLRAATPEGLRLVRTFYLDAFGFLASSANRWLLHQTMPTRFQLAVWDRVLVALSRVLDPLLGHRVGKSVVGVYELGGSSAAAGSRGPRIASS